MKLAFLRGIAGAGLLLFAVSAGMAQDRDHDRDRDQGWYQERDTFYRGHEWRAHMFQRVREDLDRVQATTFPGGGDEFRIARTKEELNELQNKLAAGRYDQPELDQVIGAMHRVVASNRLSARDRDVLNDDLNRLRDYREHHENWGR
jgi:hypothetical protein